MPKNDVYEISGRIKNLIAKKDLALTPAGLILVNTYTLMLKDLYDFADSLPNPVGQELQDLLLKKESLPEYVLSLTTPKKEYYPMEDYARSRPRFNSNEEALEHFTQEFENLGAKYDKTGEEFWLEAENASVFTEDHRAIMGLRRSMAMCRYLMNKANNGELDE